MKNSIKNFFTLSFLVIILTGCLVNGDEKATLANNKGLQYLDERKYDSAIILFKEAANTNGIAAKNKVNMLRNLAVTFSEMEETDSAKIYFRQAAENSKKNSYEYLVNTADVAILDGNIPQAIANLQAAWDIDNQKVDVNNNLGLIYLGEYGEAYLNPDKALRYNLKAYEVNSDRNTQFVLGKNYFLLKKYDKALEIFKDLHQQYPNYTGYLTSLILIHEDAGNAVDAEKLKEELKKENPEEYEANFGELE